MKLTLLLTALSVMLLFALTDSVLKTGNTRSLQETEALASARYYLDLPVSCVDVAQHTPRFIYMSDYDEKIRLVHHCNNLNASVFPLRFVYLRDCTLPWCSLILAMGFLLGLRVKDNLRQSYVSTMHLNLYLRYALVLLCAVWIFLLLQQYAVLLILLTVCTAALSLVIGIYAGVLLG